MNDLEKIERLETSVIELKLLQQQYMLFNLTVFQLLAGSDTSVRDKVLDALRKILVNAPNTPDVSPIQLQLMQMLRDVLLSQGSQDLDQLYSQPPVRPVG